MRSYLFTGVLVGLFTVSAPIFASGFDPFFFSMDGSCANPSTIQFHPVGFMKLDLGKASNGHKLEGEITIYMKSDRTFSAQYIEAETLSCETAGGMTVCEVQRGIDKWFNGSWSQDVDGAALFQGLGVATVTSYNNKPAMLLKVENGFFAPRAATKVATGWKIGTNIGENGISINQFCGIRP